jgi:hypothetical protein
MPVELKDNLSGGLDLDTALSKLPKSRYIDALNITFDAVDENNDNAPTNIIGNQIVPFNLPSGNNKTINLYPFDLRNTVIEFIWNSGSKHSIVEYDNDTGLRTLIFQSLTDSDTDILEFDEDGRFQALTLSHTTQVIFYFS